MISKGLKLRVDYEMIEGLLKERGRVISKGRELRAEYEMIEGLL